MSIFNLGEGNSSVSEDMIPGVDYRVFKDGNGVEYNILNLDNEKLMPKTGIVEFSPVKTSKRHVNNINFKQFMDISTGLIVGIPSGVDNRNKQVIWRNINIKDTVAYDLSIPAQRAMAIIVSRCPFVIGSPNYKQGVKTVYKKVDKELEAEKFIKNRVAKRKAADIAEGLSGTALYDMAYAIGKDPKFMSPTMVAQEVIMFADEQPSRFLEIFNNDSRTALVVLKRGLATGIIEHNIDRGMTYGGVPIGFSDEEAVAYLRANPSVQTAIDFQAKKKEGATQSTLSSTFKKEALDKMDEKDVQIAALQEELRKAQAEKENAAKVAHELIAKEAITESDPELASLREEAKSLKIQGWQLIKDKGKLQEKIDKAKAELNN